MRWLVSDIPVQRLQLQAPESGWAYGPNTNGRQSQVSVVVPSVEAFFFQGGTISSRSSSVVLENVVFVEPVIGVPGNVCNLAAGHLIEHFNHLAVVEKRRTLEVSAGIFLGGNGSFNYYHSLIELLPKLEYIRLLPPEYQNLPILVGADTLRMAAWRDALGRIAEKRDVIELDPECSYIVANLVYITTPNNAPFNLKPGEQMRTSYFFFRQSSIRFLRGQLIRTLPTSFGRKQAKVFLARRGTRRSYNQKEIDSLFEEFGFTKIYPEDYSLDEQIRIFSQANFVAGPTGAAWTNLIFCDPGTKAICWMAEAYSEYAGYSTLAKLTGVDLRYLFYRTAASDTGTLYEASYHLDPAGVRQVLEEMVDSSEAGSAVMCQ